MDTVKLHAAKTNLSKLVKRAEAGEEIIISRGNVPVAKLVPLPPAGSGSELARKRGYGILKGKLELPDSFFFDPLPEDELALWYGEGKEY
jgi:prevent-host-death family protein